jgi:hypothetical protein
MASRDTLDNRIDAWKDQAKDQQDTGRDAGTWGGNYGQVLRGGEKPTDQAEPGPDLGAQLKSDGWIDVYTAPEGRGWVATFEADEAGALYRRTVSSHEGGPLVETAWEPWEVQI